LQSLQILYNFVLRAEIATTFGPRMAAISARNTKTKFANFARQFCNFTHFSMLFLAVVIYFQLFQPKQ
jgi:hypothetical protein